MSENYRFFWKNDSWWARKRRKGKEFEKRLDTKDKSLGRKRADEWIKALVAQEWGEKPRRTFKEAIEKFAEDHFPTMSKRGAERYVTSIKQLMNQFGDMHLDEITSASLSEFERDRRKSVQAPTIRRDLACLSSIFTFAEEWEWVAVNPVKAFVRKRSKRGLKENEPRTRWLTHDEEAAMHRYADDAMRARMAFAVDEGLRKVEQFGITWANISFANQTRAFGIAARGEVTVPGLIAKRDKTRIVPLMERSYDMLKFMERHSMTVFPTKHGEAYSTQYTSSVWETFKRVARKAGVENVTWHDLRRTCGCRLLQDYRMQMSEVGAWLGHSSVKVTERHYAFLRVEQLHRAIEMGHSNVVNFSARGAGKGI